jgi:uncharacterized protein
MEGIDEKPVWMVLPLVLVSVFIGILIAFGLMSIFYNGEIESLKDATNEEMKIPFLFVQGLAAFMGYLVAPYFVFKSLRKKSFSYFLSNPLQVGMLLFTVLIVFSFIVVDSAIIEWNQSIHFPESLKWFEEWARAKEDHLEEITKALTNFKSLSEFAVAFVVVALLAGICEEFLFRGIIQTELFRGTKNIHVAIWLSAIFFSAFHVQFFGFVPRLLLGALFGYLYHWSGNLLVPMFAHILNNGFAIVMVYLYQLKMVGTDIESSETVAPWPVIIGCAITTVALLFFFKKKFHSPNTIS